MSRQKTRRFAENRERENVIEEGKPIYEEVKGNWNNRIFKNSNPITAEFGCGRGEYTIGLATEFRELNFVGVDLKGDRIWKGSGQAIEQNLTNVAFLRAQLQFVDHYFEVDELDEIWLTFPDPRPKDSEEKKRLTNPFFMELYKGVLAPDGWFRFKTDNTDLFNYTMDLLQTGRVLVKNLAFTHDLYESNLADEHHGITTKYEKIFSEKGETIKYLKFQFA